MAYRLERNESVLRGLKRVVRDEIESASAVLSGRKEISRDRAIHEARKSIKKIRALLRLAGDEMRGLQMDENQRLRDVARRLSHYRDAFVMVGTFDDLRKKFPAESSGKLRSVRAALLKKKNVMSREEDSRIVLDHAAAALKQVLKRVKSWKLDADGYAAIGPGLEKTYRAGRTALSHAHQDPRAANYHELRKKVKDHWYHIRLLQNLWTDVMSAYEKSLKDLETWLGNDHNLAVLRELITAQPDFYGTPKDIELMLDLIERYQKELRKESVSLAERVYEEHPREFRRRMKNLWDTWQNQPKLKSPTAA